MPVTLFCKACINPFDKDQNLDTMVRESIINQLIVQKAEIFISVGYNNTNEERFLFLSKNYKEVCVKGNNDKA